MKPMTIKGKGKKEKGKIWIGNQPLNFHLKFGMFKTIGLLAIAASIFAIDSRSGAIASDLSDQVSLTTEQIPSAISNPELLAVDSSNPQSPIPNPQSPIPNPQSPIPNPQSPNFHPLPQHGHPQRCPWGDSDLALAPWF